MALWRQRVFFSAGHMVVRNRPFCGVGRTKLREKVLPFGWPLSSFGNGGDGLGRNSGKQLRQQ